MKTGHGFQALKQLLDRFPNNKPTVGEAQWFLRDRNFDVNEAYLKLQTCLAWRKQCGMQQVTYEDIERESATGKAYLHSHPDVYGRPALVVRVAKYVVSNICCLDSDRLFIFGCLSFEMHCRAQGSCGHEATYTHTLMQAHCWTVSSPKESGVVCILH